MAFRLFGRRRLLVPEVVQTSSMDCGPASLKCMLEGFGIRASYGRLREACQTEVDGTSIDTMEEVAVQLGLEAEQVMIPIDHLLLPGSEPLPALVVVRRPPNATHFLVAWRRTGRFMQLMDPATGRRWATASKFLEEVYVHTMPVAAEGWREWASSASFTDALSKRLSHLGVGAGQSKRLIDGAVKADGWRRLAALDAATRMAESVVRSGGISRGRQAAGVVERFAERAAGEGAEDWAAIPADFWSARPAPPDEDGEEQVFLRGAVLVHVRGMRAGAKVEQVEGAAAVDVDEGTRDRTQLPPELVAALEERPARPGLELLHILRADGLFSPLVLVFAVALAAAGTVVEALMLRGLFDVGRELNLSGQRLGAVGALVVFLLTLLVLELPVVNAVLRMGRRLETRLRMLFMDKIPRLGDRYFHSRLTSDMTERSHSIHVLRQLPALGEHFLRVTFSLALTTLGIAWLDPLSAPVALLATALAVAVPLFAQPVLVERNLRVRNHAGALSRFYFDALIGLFAVRAHGAERAVRREHENLLIDWAGAGLGLLRATVTVEAVHLVAGFGLAAWMLVGYVSRAGESGGLLLFAYWVLNLPVLGQEVGLVARQYPGFRNATLRMLEPLGALEESETDEPADLVVETKGAVVNTLEADAADAQVGLIIPKVVAANAQVEEVAVAAETVTLGPASRAFEPNGDGHAATRGLSVVFEAVTVRAAGHTILDEINLSVGAYEHVAVVGSSGAGKSSLVGILLGWHRPTSGRVYVGGERLGGRRLEQLRRETAWVDPTVQLWNQTFIENLRYGSGASAADSISHAVKLADLIDVLEKLPDGLQTPLGEGGALVSGGQGQRVRLGRAMLREEARLVILDEPFRGLERDRRRRLLERARAYWRGATLLCITHDVGETLSFERVVVVDGGRVVEDGHPKQLSSDPDSRYAALLAAEEEVRTGMWSGGEWRRIRLESQRLQPGQNRLR